MSFLSVPVSLQTFLGASRTIETIDVNVILNESANDTLTITKQPVQQGASITDHAYKEPTQLSMAIYFRHNLTTSLKDLYTQFLDLQNSRVPFSITTPKRIYSSMLLSSVNQTTDKSTENCLALNLTFQEVILVAVTTTQVPRIKQKIVGSTGRTEKAGKKSALLSLVQGIGALGGG